MLVNFPSCCSDSRKTWLLSVSTSFALVWYHGFGLPVPRGMHLSPFAWGRCRLPSVSPKGWLGSHSRALSPACCICGNSTQRRCCKTLSPQWDVIEWKQMVSWGEFQGRITFSSYCLFDFTVIVWWIVSDLILQIEKLLLNVLPNVQMK